jgi:hypothetical protein
MPSYNHAEGNTTTSKMARALRAGKPDEFMKIQSDSDLKANDNITAREGCA